MGFWSRFREARRVSKMQKRLLLRDRKYLRRKVKRYVRSYRHADAAMEAETLETLARAVRECRESTGLDARWRMPPIPTEATCLAAIAAADAAIRTALKYDVEGLRKVQRHDRIEPTFAFISDTYATVAMAHRFGAGLYEGRAKLTKLGKAALKLLTTAQTRFPAH